MSIEEIDVSEQTVSQEMLRPRQNGWRLTPGRALVALILVALGFLGGVLQAKHSGTTTSSSGGAAALAGARTGGTAGFGGQGATAGGATSTVGTVKIVDGSTIYLTTGNGSVVKVSTTGATRMQVTATGTAGGLKVGSSVIIEGTTDASGDVHATSVTGGAAPTSAAAPAQ
jgi:hypothetical protein